MLKSVSHWNGYTNTLLPSAVTLTKLQCTWRYRPASAQESGILTSKFLSLHSSWGESAGAYSVGFHLVINDGITRGLFHGAFMVRLLTTIWIFICDIFYRNPDPLTIYETLQSLFDQLVADTGCSDSTDSIACLRTVPFDKLMTTGNISPNAFSFTSVRHGWQPSVDGQIIVRNPQESLQKGLYAKVRFQLFFQSLKAIFWKVPLVSGDSDDEGTYVNWINQ